MAYVSCHHESWRRAIGADMTISGKYELLQPVRAAGFRSFYARHVLTGQQVMVHFLNQGQRFEPRPPGETSAIDQTAPVAQVLDAGTYENTPFLVTHPVEDFTSLAAWLESVAPVRRSAVGSAAQTLSTPPSEAPRPQAPVQFRDVTPLRVESLPPVKTAAPSLGPGEFTAMFGGSVSPQAPRAEPATQPTAAAPATPKLPNPPVVDPGGFTGLFGAPVAPTAPAPLPAQPTYRRVEPPPLPAPPPPVSAAPTRADEFARMFLPEDRGPLPPAPIELARPVPPPAPPAPSQAGEFTMLFSGQAGPGAVAAPAPVRQPQLPPNQPSQMMPSSPVRPIPQPMPSALPAPPHDSFEGATQVFQGPGAGARNAPQQSMPMSPSGPGEFTMIMRGAPGGAPPASAFPAAPAAPPPSPGLTLPGFKPPKVTAPSMTGPAISGSGITPPTFHAPNVQAPSLAAPPITMPAMPTSAPPVAPAAGAGFSPILAAVLACLGTVALLAIVYVLIKR